MGHRTADVARALASEDRQELLLLLLQNGQLSVTKLAERLRLKQPQVSKHLNELEAVQLVQRTRGAVSLPVPALVLANLEQLTGTARSGLIRQIRELQADLDSEDERARALAEVRRRLEAEDPEQAETTAIE